MSQCKGSRQGQGTLFLLLLFLHRLAQGSLYTALIVYTPLNITSVGL
jgi:hypothetical protein